jgi:hypothetical protein
MEAKMLRKGPAHSPKREAGAGIPEASHEQVACLELRKVVRHDVALDRLLTLVGIYRCLPARDNFSKWHAWEASQ